MLMRLPRPRFTVRRLMIAIAIVAVFLGVWLWAERRRARFKALAHWHDMQVVYVVVEYLLPDGSCIFEVTSLPQKIGDPHVPPRQQRICTWNYQLAQKYRRAARYPWLPVEPDPPEPK